MAIASLAENDRGPRFAAIDIVRGVAILAMIVYHAAFDLSAERLIATNVVTEPGWVLFARLIAGTFLALVGFNLVLAARHGLKRGPFLRRLALIAGAAALVSLGTWWMQPQTFVFFGILHQIALASVLALPFLRLPVWVVAVAAAAVIGAPFFLRHAVFDTPTPWWVGLSTVPPVSVDYVPVFPWFGVVLAGVVAGRLFLDHGGESRLARWRPAGGGWKWLAFAGRWSLPVYLVHQPVILAILYLLNPFLTPGEAVARQNFTNECVTACRVGQRDEATCTAFCGCMFTGLHGTDLFTVQAVELMTPDQHRRWTGIVERCVAAPPAN